MLFEYSVATMPEDKDTLENQPSTEDLAAVEAIMGPVPDFPMAGADLQRDYDAKKHSIKESAGLHGHSFRKKPAATKAAKKSKIAVSFNDDNKEATDKPKTSKIKVAVADEQKPQSKTAKIKVADADAAETPVAKAESVESETPPKKGIVVRNFADESTVATVETQKADDSAPRNPASDTVEPKISAVTEPKQTSPLKIAINDTTVTHAEDDQADEDSLPSAPPLPATMPTAKPELKPVQAPFIMPAAPKPLPPKPAPNALGDIRPGSPVAPVNRNSVPLPPSPRAPLQPNPIPVAQAPMAPASRPRPVDGMAINPQARASSPKLSLPVAPSQSLPQSPSSAHIPGAVPPSQIARPTMPRPSLQTTVGQPRPAVPKVKKSPWRFLKIAGVRWALGVSLVLAVLVIGLLPATRYPILNIAGVRVSASLLVKDDKTSLPLKNVTVAIAGTEVKTDEDGRASFTGLKLGKQPIAVKKIGFETLNKSVVLGWGSNPLGDYGINAVGAQYAFVVKDWLSQKPLAKAEVVSGDASAYTDENGMALLTTDTEIEGKLEVTIKASGYRTEAQTIDAQDKNERQQVLVPSRQHYFVSKRSGKYDVYKIDIDGKNESLVIAGSGVETDDIKLIPHPTKPAAALVASRENARNKDGFLLSGLYMIDFETNELEKITLSERIEIIAWQNNYLVYAKIAEGASNTNPQRHRLMSHNIEDGSDKEIAASNYFNDILAVNNFIYYAPSNAFQENPNAQLYRVKADGSEQISIVNKEVWNMFRLAYDSVDVLQHQDWYTFKIGDTLATKKANGPANPKHRIYVDSPDGKRSAWVDERDGQGVIVLYDLEKRQDTILYAKTGATYPVRWLNDDYIIFRVTGGSETADYVMYVNGKEPLKIRDVSNSAYIGRWYYY